MICFGLCFLVLTWSQLAHAPFSNDPYAIYRDDHIDVRNFLLTTNEPVSDHLRLAFDTYLHPGYYKDTIPLKNSSKPIEVYLRVSLRKILEVEEFKQQIKVNVWVHQTWKDEYLTWKPEEYEGVSIMRVKHAYIWVPDIVLYTSGEEDEEPLDHINAIVTHEGTVMYRFPAVYQVTCNMDVRWVQYLNE